MNARRGMTLLELLLALTITTMVGAALVAMLQAVSTAIGAKRDNRTAMVSSNAAQSRLSSYIAPARAFLDSDGDQFVLWAGDTRESDTVHATEIRWFAHDGATDTIDVWYVDFPDEWTQTAKDLADEEVEMTANWDTVFDYYFNNGWVSSLTIVDGVESLAITHDDADAQSAQHVNFDITFATTTSPLTIQVCATISVHEPPES